MVETMQKSIQFIDLGAQQSRIRESVETRIQKVLDHGKYIMGPEVHELEETLANYVGVKHCVTCASGTDALIIPLLAYGVGPGDAIITTPFTFFATAEVISLLGATPVFVDIEADTYNINPHALQKILESDFFTSRGLRPRGIIPVDLFGQPADYSEIEQIAKKHDLFVIEDAAQSFGAEYQGKKAGCFGDAASTSFFPAKPLGCYGDGGAIFTDNDLFADKMKSIRVHGQGHHKYDNVRIGINGRLDTMQAAVLLAKLEIFDEELPLRNTIAARYSEMLKEKFVTPIIKPDRTCVWAQYSILSDARDEMVAKAKSRGVPTAIYYPKPLHLQPAFANLGYSTGDFPVSEEIAGRIFSLPMHPYLGREEQGYILNALLED